MMKKSLNKFRLFKNKKRFKSALFLRDSDSQNLRSGQIQFSEVGNFNGCPKLHLSSCLKVGTIDSESIFNRHKIVKKCLISGIFLISFYSAISNATNLGKYQQSNHPKRIQSVLFDKGEAHRIFLTPGLGSVIVFPCFVIDGFLGDESQASVKFSPTTKKNMLLNLKSTASHVTNLIVRCENQSSHFVFDIVPSQTIHQDVLEIRAGFGRPEFIPQSNLELIKDDRKKEVEKTANKTTRIQKRIIVKGPEVISESLNERSNIDLKNVRKQSLNKEISSDNSNPKRK